MVRHWAMRNMQIRLKTERSPSRARGVILYHSNKSEVPEEMFFRSYLQNKLQTVVGKNKAALIFGNNLRLGSCLGIGERCREISLRTNLWLCFQAQAEYDSYDDCPPIG